MTAGSGIVHSERASDDIAVTSRLHGIQSWLALPLDLEETDPSFIHYPAGELPEAQHGGCTVHVIMGEAYGLRSPVRTYSPTLYLEVEAARGAALALPRTDELAVYVVEGVIAIAGREYREGTLAVAAPSADIVFEASSDSRLMVLGGANLGPRHIWWNFVSSSKERIERAKRDWAEGRFAKVPGDDEFIPLPER
jgi:redox-sensitive bicupin YhaK (pirin superfamily)